MNAVEGTGLCPICFKRFSSLILKLKHTHNLVKAQNIKKWCFRDDFSISWENNLLCLLSWASFHSSN